jgi:hypothetical protein
MKIARLQQVSNADQQFAIRLDDKECLPDSVVGGRFACRGDGDQPSARAEDAPGTLQSLTADSVEYDVHARDVFLEARSHSLTVSSAGTRRFPMDSPEVEEACHLTP